MGREKKGSSEDSNTVIERALGVKWNAEDDHFIFMLGHLRDIEPPTTRKKCLSLIAKVFDPMGFIAPYLLRPKKLLCNLSLDWDDEVPQENLTTIWRWQKTLDKIQEYQIPR
jgi:hypothetical protein